MPIVYTRSIEGEPPNSSSTGMGTPSITAEERSHFPDPSTFLPKVTAQDLPGFLV